MKEWTRDWFIFYDTLMELGSGRRFSKMISATKLVYWSKIGYRFLKKREGE